MSITIAQADRRAAWTLSDLYVRMTPVERDLLAVSLFQMSKEAR